MQETLTLLYVNNKGANRPAHPKSLISVILFLDSVYNSKTCHKQPLTNRQNKGLKDKW